MTTKASLLFFQLQVQGKPMGSKVWSQAFGWQDSSPVPKCRPHHYFRCFCGGRKKKEANDGGTAHFLSVHSSRIGTWTHRQSYFRHRLGRVALSVSMCLSKMLQWMKDKKISLKATGFHVTLNWFTILIFIWQLEANSRQIKPIMGNWNSYNIN